MKHTRLIKLFATVLATLMIYGCSTWQEPATSADGTPSIFPDYTGVTIPCNIAPMNFMIEDAKQIQAEFSVDGTTLLQTIGKDGVIDISQKEWEQLINDAIGKTICVSVSIWNKEHPEGIGYQPFEMHVTADSIDDYLVYRLIEPSYIEYRQLGIYQRQISTFKEEAIVTNKTCLTTCINCHSFSSYSPENIMFHIRGPQGGTFIYEDENYRKIDFTKIGIGKNMTYPAWHPEGRYIAFSSNTTHQVFYTEGRQQVEVFDTASNLVIYDVKTGEVITDPRFLTEDILETFPAWSADGKELYFASHKARETPVTFTPDMQYDLVKVSFDPETGRFGEQVDTLYNSRSRGGSVSYPRVSPDGRYLLYTLSDYGTFPIWHNEADLRMIDLATGADVDINVWNSPDQAESYHNWSSNGKWVVFGSRRLDGRFTRLFIAHIGADGTPCKPFLLPQKDPRENEWRLKSFNVPEFVTGKVELPKEVNPYK